ncbi:barrier-to-autointegration factor [Pithys albifrons albifrons]|uniref:barrier-to-autointegration factor n=1 Tax=Pithys albifrons albifrons TaxID=3385563 RepID=UPI003A5CB868
MRNEGALPLPPKKHQLMTEPWGNKPVQALPKIGRVLGKHLERSGFDTVRHWGHQGHWRLGCPHGCHWKDWGVPKGLRVSLGTWGDTGMSPGGPGTPLGTPCAPPGLEQFQVLHKDEELLGTWRWEEGRTCLGILGGCSHSPGDPPVPLQVGKVILQYLALQRNEEEFWKWLKKVCKANAKQSQDVLAYLRSWCNNFLGSPLGQTTSCPGPLSLSGAAPSPSLPEAPQHPQGGSNPLWRG